MTIATPWLDSRSAETTVTESACKRREVGWVGVDDVNASNATSCINTWAGEERCKVFTTHRWNVRECDIQTQ